MTCGVSQPLNLPRNSSRLVSNPTVGAALARPAEAITMLDVFRAVDSLDGGRLFDFHTHPNPDCPVGSRVHDVLDGELADAQAALERRLAQATLADLLKRLN